MIFNRVPDVNFSPTPIRLSKLLLVSLSSLLNTPRKMHKSKLSQNFYTIGRNNEAKSLSSNLALVSSCISNVYIKKITNEGKYTQVFATSILDSSHFCGLVIADGGLYSYHNIGNATALVNRSTYKVVCSNAGNLARLSITGMGTWDECVVISNRDFKLTHE